MRPSDARYSAALSLYVGGRVVPVTLGGLPAICENLALLNIHLVLWTFLLVQKVLLTDFAQLRRDIWIS